MPLPLPLAAAAAAAAAGLAFSTAADLGPFASANRATHSTRETSRRRRRRSSSGAGGRTVRGRGRAGGCGCERHFGRCVGDEAYESLLRRRHAVDAIAGVELSEVQRRTIARARAVRVVQQPVVGAERRMEPHAVVYRRHLHVLVPAYVVAVRYQRSRPNHRAHTHAHTRTRTDAQRVRATDTAAAQRGTAAAALT